MAKDAFLILKYYLTFISHSPQKPGNQVSKCFIQILFKVDLSKLQANLTYMCIDSLSYFLFTRNHVLKFLLRISTYYKLSRYSQCGFIIWLEVL